MNLLHSAISTAWFCNHFSAIISSLCHVDSSTASHRRNTLEIAGQVPLPIQMHIQEMAISDFQPLFRENASFSNSNPRKNKTSCRWYVGSLLCRPLNVSYNDDKITMLSLKFPEKFHGITCIGSCNGFLGLIMEYSELFVYKPSTQECKEISGFGGPIEITYLYGFGYAESIDDYKLVKIAGPGEIVEVYSLRKDSWTSIESDFLFPEKYYEEGAFVKAGFYLNGAIHWAFENRDCSCVIAAFDLVEEKFKTLPPPETVLKGNCKYTLGVLKGFLCLASDKSDGQKDFWVMPEYGVLRSWKRFGKPKFSKLRPLGLLSHCKTMLLMTEEGLLMFRDKKDKMKKVEVGVMYQVDDKEQYYVLKFGTEDSWHNLHVYTESLVSPEYKSNFTTQDNH